MSKLLNLPILKSAPVISLQSQDWIFDKFHRLFDQLGNSHFSNSTQLILPNPAFFPATADNADEMARATLAQIKEYAGMTGWPIDIGKSAISESLPKLEFNGGYHGTGVVVRSDYSDNNRIMIGLDLIKFPKAETLVATLSQHLSSILLTYTDLESPPQEYVAFTEILGTFLGFGVMLANTSYQFRGGCGSCYNSAANRQTGLSEEEMIFSLALFCQLKGIANKEVLPHLKSYLRSLYKKSVRDIAANSEQFSRLKARL